MLPTAQRPADVVAGSVVAVEILHPRHHCHYGAYLHHHRIVTYAVAIGGSHGQRVSPSCGVYNFSLRRAETCHLGKPSVGHCAVPSVGEAGGVALLQQGLGGEGVAHAGAAVRLDVGNRLSGVANLYIVH